MHRNIRLDQKIPIVKSSYLLVVHSLGHGTQSAEKFTYFCFEIDKFFPPQARVAYVFREEFFHRDHADEHCLALLYALLNCLVPCPLIQVHG